MFKGFDSLQLPPFVPLNVDHVPSEKVKLAIHTEWQVAHLRCIQRSLAALLKSTDKWMPTPKELVSVFGDWMEATPGIKNRLMFAMACITAFFPSRFERLIGVDWNMKERYAQN